ncbi:MAG: hypothetical protein IJU78_02145 [Clostridia bacterium]|nr:hypothetical protein [Clostridia bacterium]
MDKTLHYACYEHGDEWYLIEMLLDISASEIDWDDICVPQPALPRDDWQVPYMEQYLDESGTERLCDIYDVPDGSVKPCRVAFFIFKEGEAGTLSTPYGDFELRGGADVPERLKRILEFAEAD